MSRGKGKIGSLANNDSCAGVRGNLDKLTNHLLPWLTLLTLVPLLTLEPCAWLLYTCMTLHLIVINTGMIIVSYLPIIHVTIQIILCNNLLNLLTSLSLTLVNLTSLTMSMNSLYCHCFIVSVTMENNLDLLASMLPLLSWRMPLMHFTISCKSCFPTLLMIFLATLLMFFLFKLNLTLTQACPLLIHLNVNILWLILLHCLYSLLSYSTYG